MKDKFRLIEETDIKDFKGRGIFLEHIKTKAKIVVISNDDSNKVFNITFKTPPYNDTGLPHIMEHSVLCGSKKYPIKDPFVELAKGSLNTFLNAMTYPDKTTYPVASTNDKDFKNLVDVYLDAVFNPRIYAHKEIFMQEGWHYSINDKSKPLEYNGVVYSEMKGAYSSIDDLMERNIQKLLYKDTPYYYESGGDPDKIPDLIYEEFLDFHRKYYHPSNSIIYLYGDMNWEDYLDYIDKDYLSKYDYLEIDSHINYQKPYEDEKRLVVEYPVHEEKDNNYCYLYAKVIDIRDDEKLDEALTLLYVSVFNSTAAPVRQALIKSGICENVIAHLELDMNMPYLFIMAKNAKKGKEEEFKKIINDAVEDIVNKGVDKQSVLAAINSTEFFIREGNYLSAPKGLIYSLNILRKILYIQDNIFEKFTVLDKLQKLKELLETNYYEEILKKYFLNNNHSGLIIGKPVLNLDTIKNDELASKLESIKNKMSESELEDIVAENTKLVKYQKEEDSIEDIKKIPILKKQDIRKDALEIRNQITDYEYGKVVYHDYDTNGIAYVDLLFPLNNISNDELQDLNALSCLYNKVDTNLYTYKEISDEIAIKTGGISFNVICAQEDDTKKMKGYFKISIKTFSKNIKDAIKLTEEILFNSKFEDISRIKELISEEKNSIRENVISSGNLMSYIRASARIDQGGLFEELTMGYSMYKYYSKLLDNLCSDVIQKIVDTKKKFLKKGNIIVSITSSESDKDEVSSLVKELVSNIDDTDSGSEKYLELKLLDNCNEAIIIPSPVNYVSRVGQFNSSEYKGYYQIFSTIMSYDYLWQNLRVEGGAYGCRAKLFPSGVGVFSSYRDPHLLRSDNIYKMSSDYLKNMNLDEMLFNKFIIGTFSNLDMPKYANLLGMRSLRAYIENKDYEQINRTRKELLDVTQDDIRKMSKVVDEVINNSSLCVIGSKEKINEHKSLFDNIEVLV